jgi:hypothetical protein
MRPRKQVLLVCADEVQASRVAFVLDTHLYAVTRCDSKVSAARAIHSAAKPFDGALVIVACDTYISEAIVCDLRRLGLRVALLPNRPTLMATQATQVLPLNASMAELLAAVKILVSRKRGPCHGSVYASRKPLRGVLDASRAYKIVAGERVYFDAGVVMGPEFLESAMRGSKGAA